MLLLDLATDETTSLREVWAQSWSPTEDVAVVSRVQVAPSAPSSAIGCSQQPQCSSRFGALSESYE
jgi:hypothetical protein